MRSRLSLVAALLLLLVMQPSITQAAAASGYDPKADADAALNIALAEAKAGSKQVLVIAGGDWCSWCYYLETFLKKNPDIDSALHQSFVVVKVYVGDTNKNAAFFSRLPKANGYPHFWVIGSNGKLRKSVNTGLLEDGGKSYDKGKFMEFVRKQGQ